GWRAGRMSRIAQITRVFAPSKHQFLQCLPMLRFSVYALAQQALELRSAAHAPSQGPNRVGVEVLLAINLFGTSEAHLPYITPAKGIEENCPFVNNFSQTN